MTIFGIIWMAIIVYCFFSKDIEKMLFLALTSMIFQSTNMIVINEISMGPQIVTCTFFLIKCILIRKEWSKISINKINIGATMIICSVIISSLINNTLGKNILKIVQLIIYMLTFFNVSYFYKFIEIKNITKFLKNLTVFVLSIGIIQILSSGSIIQRIPVISELFFNERAQNIYYWHNNYFRLTSVFMEPSYCGCFLVGVFFYFCSIYKSNDIRMLILLIATLIGIIMTQSTTAYLSVFIVSIIFLIWGKNKYVKRILISSVVIFMVLMILFGSNLLDKVIFSKANSGSSLTRTNWNQNAIEAFKKSKIIGIGYKNLRASSIIYSILGELGIVGLISYIFFNFQIYKKIFKTKKSEIVGLSYSIVAITICQIISCPDLDLCIYWLFLDLVSLSGMKFKNREAFDEKR